MKNFIPIILILIGCFIGWFIKPVPSYNPPINKIDTIYHIDTFIKLVPKLVYEVRVDTDTVLSIDSIKVPVMIPIQRKVYSDSSYRAVVSGYHVSLDTMEVKNKTVFKTIVIKELIKPKFSFGVQSGYGIGGWYVGIGGQYNFISF